MSDYAHEQTNAMLEALEQRIKAAYQQAYSEVYDKFKRYVADFERKDADMQKAVKAGTITKQQHITWRCNQIAAGGRWRALRDELARAYSAANQTAMAYARGELPEVYALNMNYAAYQLEQRTGTVIADTLASPETVRELLKENRDVLPPCRVDIPLDERWNRQRITGEVLQGILQGESTSKLADRMKNVTDANRAGALRTARTATTAAQSMGRMASYRAAEEKGIVLQKMWLSTMDGRTRHTHRQLDGQKRRRDEPFEVEGKKIRFPGDPQAHAALVYNCRCTLIADVAGVKEIEPVMRRVKNPDTGRYELIPDMTYREWEESRRLAKPAFLGYNNHVSSPPLTDNFKRMRGPHTRLEDLIATNPNHKNGYEYTINCNRCVSAYEARRRGYDVRAKPAVLQGRDTLAYRNDPDGWPSVYQGAILENCGSNTTSGARKKVEALLLGYGHGARAIVAVQWNGRPSGHVFIAENDGGKIRFVDPQIGKDNVSYYFNHIKPRSSSVLRIDNREFTDAIMDCCE